VSLSLLLALLVQPQWLRVSLWRRMRGLAADERTFAVASAVTVHTGAYVSANLCAAAAYWWQPRWLDQFRVQPQSPWPWQLRGGERSAYRRLVVRSLLLVAANLLLIAPALLWLAFPVQRAAGLQCGVDSLPSWSTSAAQMALLAVVEDTIFYVRKSRAAATATAAALARPTPDCKGGGATVAGSWRSRSLSISALSSLGVHELTTPFCVLALC